MQCFNEKNGSWFAKMYESSEFEFGDRGSAWPLEPSARTLEVSNVSTLAKNVQISSNKH